MHELEAVEYVVNADDVAYLNYYHTQRSPTMRHARLRLSSILFIVGVMMLFLIPSPVFALAIATGMMVSSGLVAVRRGGPTRQQTEHIRQLFNEGNNRALFGRHKMLLFEDHLEVTTDYSRGEISWEGVERVEEDEQYIFIYISALNAYIINKQYFPSAAEAHRFFERARTLHLRAAQLQGPPTPAMLPNHVPQHLANRMPERAPFGLPAPAPPRGLATAGADGTDGDI